MHGSLMRRLDRAEAILKKLQNTPHPVLGRLSKNPSELMSQAGMTPDTWQERLLTSNASRILLLCSRQAGKSTVAGALALNTALLKPKSLVLLLSPSLRQSGELFRKVMDLFFRLVRPLGVVAENALQIEFTNGSRIVSLPAVEGTIRGFSGVAMLIIDEASRVKDALYYAVRPMLAVSQGRLIALSTPFGKRGWYHEEWSGNGDWERVKVAAENCPRITPAFLAEERSSLGERWFQQEYRCSFEDSVGSVFSHEDIMAAFSSDVEVLEI